jgi:hypothetical protein
VALSPDGSKALVVSSETPPAVSIVPTGTGQRRDVDLGPLQSVTAAAWHPDGRLLVDLVRPDGKDAVRAVAPEGRDAGAPLPEGVKLLGANSISPDGSRITARDAQGRLVVCTLAAPACRPVPGADSRDDVAGWTADGTSLFVYQGQAVPTQVSRLDVTTGARSPWRTVHPVNPALSGLRSLVAAPDGSLAYDYSRSRAELYLVRGLK